MPIYFALAALAACFVYSHPEAKVVANREGYAIMPVRWAMVRCLDDRLSYRIQGDEKEIILPHHIRKQLQSEYEKVCVPSKTAKPSDLTKVFGPVNLLNEKNHVLWVFPIHTKQEGYALVFIQNPDGTFVAGSYSLGLSGN